MKQTVWILLATSLVIGNAAWASGSIGGGSTIQRTQPRQVDPIYDQGKAVFKGKVRDYGKIKFCLAHPESGEIEKAKGRSLKRYRDGSVNTFASNLYNCETPDQRMSTVLSQDDLFAVIYYLNKRYKLRLGA